ncbi:MAG: protein kinase, partial [Vicinamibacterales bacterium]
MNCGRELPQPSVACPACGTPVSTGDSPTMLGVPGRAPDDDATVLGPPAGRADDDATVLGIPGGSRDDDATVLGSSGGPPPDDDATVLGVPGGPGGPGDGAGDAPTAPGTGPAHTISGPDAPTGVATPPPPAGSTGPLATGQQFSARYLIVKLLGIGGMGAVYQAWDAELGVMVALKVIRPEASKDATAAQDIERRFKQELLLARQVTHKNVVRIHDLGEIDGIKYITMPFIQGEDLASVLKREGRLPVERVMPLARQIAAGLAAAHDAGVVHRDLKPANVMIDGDHAVIMDFGIARTAGGGAAAVRTATAGTAAGTLVEDELTRVASATMGTAGTVAGAVIGTVQYMAPEQARGEPVDQRADIYAFGLMLYDMLLGHGRATRAGSAIAELQQRLVEAPPSIRSLVPEVPEALDRLIATCIAPAADDRFPTTADLVHALDRLDDRGRVRPIRRVVGLPLVGALTILLLSLSGLIWWSTRPPVVHDPVSVLVADFSNGTQDPSLDGVMAPTLQLALEGAGFINAFDRAGIRRTLGVRPPDVLDQEAAREIAIKHGVGVVLSGSLEPDNRGYVLKVQAVRSVTGEQILSADDRAASKDQVIPAITDLATKVRRALGDDESVSAQRFAMETLSARSLEAVRDYASAMDALSRSRFEDALQNFSSAVKRDPDFGLAYAGMAIASRNLDRQQDAETYAKEAVSHVDSMTEREAYRTRGLFFMVTGDHQKCVDEYGELIKRYSADAAARNNLALCSTYLRDWPTALEEMKEVVKILPGRALYRENQALYLSYAGHFDEGEQAALAMQDPGVFGLLALAFAHLGQGRLDDAMRTYEQLGAIDEMGASYRTSGLGDLAMFSGRFSDAVRLFSDGAATDLASGDALRAASKLAEVAHVRLLQGRPREAVAAAGRALDASQAVKIQFLAARVFAEAGETARAEAVAAELSSQFQPEPRAYGKIIEGLIALHDGRARNAVTTLMDANSLQDTWIGHFDLGRAYLAAEAYTQADSEFDRC